MTPDRSEFIDALYFRLFSWFERDPARRRGWQGPGEGTAGIATDIGPEREENQDRAAIAKISTPDGADYLLAIVCDGIGCFCRCASCISGTRAASAETRNSVLMNAIRPIPCSLRSMIGPNRGHSSAPSGTTPCVRYRQSATSNLRATATMAIRLILPRLSPTLSWNHRLRALPG